MQGSVRDTTSVIISESVLSLKKMQREAAEQRRKAVTWRKNSAFFVKRLAVGFETQRVSN